MAVGVGRGVPLTLRVDVEEFELKVLRISVGAFRAAGAAITVADSDLPFMVPESEPWATLRAVFDFGPRTTTSCVETAVGDAGKVPGRARGSRVSGGGSIRWHCIARASIDAVRAARAVCTSCRRWKDGGWRGRSALRIMSS